MMLLIRSQFYNMLMYLLILGIGIVYTPVIWRHGREGAYRGIHRWIRINKVLLRKIVGIETEIRGKVPTEPAIICSKHMSFLDIVLLGEALPRPQFIMKAELTHAPVLGRFARAIGSVPVKRGQGGKAVASIVEGMSENAKTGQTIIYPQGTRVLPGQKLPYKKGAAAMYQAFGLPAYMVATNVGVLWARKSPYRYSGTAIIEFLPQRIEPGLSASEFIETLETNIEKRSNELMAEYPPQNKPD